MLLVKNTLFVPGSRGVSPARPIWAPATSTFPALPNLSLFCSDLSLISGNWARTPEAVPRAAVRQTD